MATQIIVDGGFGREVAEHLVTLLTSAGETARVTDCPGAARMADIIAAAGLAIRASWREVHTEIDEFAATAAAVARPWLPVVLVHPHVRVGPVFLPDRSPCHTCFRVRTRQHRTADAEVSDEFDRLQALDDTLGVTGYPPHVAALAAGLAVSIVRQVTTGGGQAAVGRCTQINYVTDAMRVWRVIPVHGCPHCHPAVEQQAAVKVRADRLRELARRCHGESDDEE